jgi:hypothetical protein
MWVRPVRGGRYLFGAYATGRRSPPGAADMALIFSGAGMARMPHIIAMSMDLRFGPLVTRKLQDRLRVWCYQTCYVQLVV